LDDGAAAGVGELVGGVDATCAHSDTLGGFDDTLCWDQIKEIGRRGAGADAAPRRCRSMRTMSSAPLLSMTVVTSRVSRAGVHNPDMVSIGDPSSREHSTGGSGAAIAAPRAGMP